MTTFIQLECEYRYDFPSDVDDDYVLTNDHADVMESVNSAHSAFLDMDDEDVETAEVRMVSGGLPGTYNALMFHLRAGHAQSISVENALKERGIVLLMDDGRIGITIGSRGVIESAGEDLGLLLVRVPERYISAFLLPGVEYPSRIRRMPTVYPRWPSTTIEGSIEEE